MKPVYSILVGLMFFGTAQAEVVFSPSKEAASDARQIRVQFPEAMVKVDNPFTVKCDPDLKGFGNWADNNTTWVYNIETKVDDWGDFSPLPGGTGCAVEQASQLSTVSGIKSYALGELSHSFVVEGPKVEQVYKLPGFGNSLREENPVLLILFDGDVEKESIVNAGGSFFWYPIKDGYPSEKMLLEEVPEDKRRAMFDAFSQDYAFGYRDVNFEDGNYVLVTVNRSLIPGSKINLSLSGIKSAYASGAVAEESDIQLSVRDAFKAKLNCARYSEGSANCRPESGLSVSLNSKVRWGDVKDSYISYIPQDSKDGLTIKAYPSSEGIVYNWLEGAARGLGIDVNDDVLVERLNFNNVRVAPNTSAQIVLQSNIIDVDSRGLNLSGFEVVFGDFSEIIRFPENLTVMERNVPGNTALPVTVLNLNQKLSIIKSGDDKTEWSAVTNMPDIISMLVAYREARNAEYREDLPYVSPSRFLGLPFSEESVTLSGDKNKHTFLSLPFSGNRKSGVYAVEIRSDISSRKVSSYNLTLLTDLNVHLKKGENASTAWVTSYDTGLPVANAQIEVYDCNSRVAVKGSTNTDGLFSFNHEKVSQSCDDARNRSYLVSSGEFFVAARTESDMAFTHTSYDASEAYIYNSPNLDYVYSSLSDGEATIHSLVGVNLVKPGQSVPVQLTAVIPTQTGFSGVNPKDLPQSVTVSSNNSDIEYKFPLSWVNGSAEFTWDVPESAELGSYSLSIVRPGNTYGSRIGTDIEVSEFKVPLMSASLSLENGPLVKPSELKVSGLVRFANGIGAKDLDTEVSYYFAPSGLYISKYQGFDFVRGSFGDLNEEEKLALPTSEQLGKIESVLTDSEGSISLDLGVEKNESGESLTEILAGANRPYDLIVRMKYQDQMGEFQTASAGQTIYDASSYLGTQVSKGSINAEGSLDVVVVGLDGKTYTNLLDLDVSVLQIKTHVMGEEVFGGFIKNTFETELIKTSWAPECSMSEEGVAKCSAKGLSVGDYVLSVVSRSTNQETHSKFKVDSKGVVTGDGDYYYFDEESKGLAVAADKEIYKGGDNVELSFESPFEDCSALVTLERQEVVKSYVDKNACANGYVNIDVDAENAPNIFASVYLVTGRADGEVSPGSFDLGKPTYNVGYVNLKVDWEKYALDVDVQMDKEEYKPGDVAVAEVSVQAQLDSLEGSTVTLIAIEEEILNLKNNDSMKVLQALMGERGHSVSTMNMYDHLNSVAEVEALEELALSPVVAEGAERKDGEEGGSGSEMESFQRKLFDSLVAFETNVPVLNGKAFVDFKLNDKLTKFKVFAVVSDVSNKYGTGETSYLANQEVQAYSNIPSVARTGDEYPATITVQNNGSQSATYTVVIDYTLTDANGRVTLKSVQQSVNVDKEASRSVSVGDVVIPDGAVSADYAITVYNENGIVVDALKPPTQDIQASIPLSVQDEFLVQMTNGPVEIDLVKDQRALEGQGELDTKVFSSIVSSTEYAVNKSISESLFSGLTPEGQILKALVSASEENQLPLNRMYGELLSSIDTEGFVKYYSGSNRGNFWLTAELVQLIATKPWAVSLMPESMMEKLVNSFSKVIDGRVSAEYIADKSDAEAWMSAKVKAANALIVLDKRVGAALANEVYTQAKLVEYRKYSSDVVADMVVLAANASPEEALESPMMKYMTESLLVVKDTSAILSGSSSYSAYGYSDEVIATAKVVKALSNIAAVTQANSSANYLDNLVLGLVQANKAGNWYTNRTKVWVLNGLSNFARTYESVPVNGTTVITSSTSGVSSNITWKDELSSLGGGLAGSWESDSASINVIHNGEGRPWVSVVAKAAVKLEAPNYQGLKVTKLVTNKSSNDGTFTAGDLLQVDITIENPADQPHVALFDPIPAGANILSDGWGPYSSAQKSYSGYRVYFNNLRSGSTKVSYQYQLNNPGSFKLPQTRVEALYEPGLFGEVPNAAMNIVK